MTAKLKDVSNLEDFWARAPVTPEGGGKIELEVLFDRLVEGRYPKEEIRFAEFLDCMGEEIEELVCERNESIEQAEKLAKFRKNFEDLVDKLRNTSNSLNNAMNSLEDTIEDMVSSGETDIIQIQRLHEEGQSEVGSVINLVDDFDESLGELEAIW